MITHNIWQCDICMIVNTISNCTCRKQDKLYTKETYNSTSSVKFSISFGNSSLNTLEVKFLQYNPNVRHIFIYL